MVTELTLDARTAQYTVQTVGRLLATFAILQGLNIMLGGRQRWAGDSFAVALMLPGAPPTWGVILFTFGVTALLGSLRGRFRPVAFGLFGCATWCIFFAMSVGLAALGNPNAATTGVWTYGTLSLVFVLIGVAYTQSRKVKR